MPEGHYVPNAKEIGLSIKFSCMYPFHYKFTFLLVLKYLAQSDSVYIWRVI